MFGNRFSRTKNNIKGEKFKYRKTAKRKAETYRQSNIFNGFAYKWELIETAASMKPVQRRWKRKYANILNPSNSKTSRGRRRFTVTDTARLLRGWFWCENSLQIFSYGCFLFVKPNRFIKKTQTRRLSSISCLKVLENEIIIITMVGWNMNSIMNPCLGCLLSKLNSPVSIHTPISFFPFHHQHRTSS